MAEHCAVIGVGQTKYDAKRVDVSMPGLLREAALRALEEVRTHPERRETVRARAEELRHGLAPLAATLRAEVRGHGHIIPLLIGDEARAVALADALRRREIDVRAIRPPTVPPATSRLRFTVTARHSSADIRRAVDALAAAAAETR